MEAWEKFEEDVQSLLKLSPTPVSGALYQAPGDAVDTRHPREEEIRLMADCKLTQKKTFSLGLKFLLQWEDKAASFGRRFVLPIRFYSAESRRKHDYVVVGLDDFVDLCQRAGVLR